MGNEMGVLRTGEARNNTALTRCLLTAIGRPAFTSNI